MIWPSKRSEYFAEDCFEGMVLAFPEKWQKAYIQKNSGVIMNKKLSTGSYALIISGGAGNGPLFHSYVGDDLADAAAVGGPYSAPNAYAIYEAGKILGKDKGILLLYNNFAGDYLNNDMAEELLRFEGIEVETVVCKDDIASAVGEKRDNRSGRSGVLFLIKLAGAYKKEGLSLKEAAKRLREASLNIATLSVHVDFDKKEIYYGRGFSGEPPICVKNHMDMELCAREACDMIIDDLKPDKNKKIFLLINRLRLTSYSDAYIMLKYVHDYLSENYNISEMRAGSFSNIIDTYGFDISIFSMDEDIEKLMHKKIYQDACVI